MKQVEGKDNGHQRPSNYQLRQSGRERSWGSEMEESMARYLLAVATLALVGGASVAEDDPAKAEMKKLEGTWQLISAVKDGKHTPDEVIKKVRVVIKGGKHTVFFGEETVAKEVPFTIDPTKSPKITTDTLPDGKEIRGIYKLEGDTLTSCVAEAGKDRPSDFASRPGSGHTLRVFKRVTQ